MSRNKLDTIYQFDGQQENRFFDIKAVGKKPNGLTQCVQGFLNDYERDDDTPGYIIVGFPEAEGSIFDTTLHGVIDTKFVAQYANPNGKAAVKTAKGIHAVCHGHSDSVNPITPLNYAEWFRFELYKELEKKTSNWPVSQDKREELVAIDLIPVEADVGQAPEFVDEPTDHTAYVIVITIQKSPFRPHADINKPTKKQTSDDPIHYHIRRDKRLLPDETTYRDGETGKMTDEEITSELASRSQRLPANKDKVYTIYGQKVEDAFVLCYHNQVEQLRELLIALPGLRTSTNARGDTLLHNATLYGQLEMIDMLVNLGLSPHQSNEDGWTAAFFAAYAGKADNLEFLLAKIHPIQIKHQSDRLGFNLFLMASHYGKVHIVEMLLDKYPDLITNSLDFENQNGLQVAAYGGEVAMVQWFLDNDELCDATSINKAIAVAETYLAAALESTDDDSGERVAAFETIRDILTAKQESLSGRASNFVGGMFGGSSSTGVDLDGGSAPVRTRVAKLGDA